MHRLLSQLKRLFPSLLAGIILLSALPSWAQDRTVTGNVKSGDDQQNFPGVNVVVKGTTIGTVTDADGNYSIQVPSSESILVFSAIGYANREQIAGTQTVIDVALDIDVTSLAEVVVVGYGTVKKSDITGALSRVTAETIQERPAQNVLQTLQGKAAGVNISSNVKPGEIGSVRIRGNRSLQATNEPLYVVDGIPFTAGSLGDINPNDIASVEILKDASATAIYGSRGANGVILVNTKKGAKGKVTINYNGTVSFDSYKSLTDWQDAGQRIDNQRLSLMNGGLYNTAQFTNLNTPVVLGYPDPDEDIARMGLAADLTAQESVLMGYEWEDGIIGGTPIMRPTTAAEQAQGWPAEVPVYDSKNIRDYNWGEAVLQQGITNNHQISLSSGTETSRLYMSITAYDQKGVQQDQNYKRYNGFINGDITANRWLTLGTSINTSLSIQNYGVNGPNSSNTGSKDLYSRALDQLPYAQPEDANGVPIRNPGGNLSLWNPIIDIDQAINERRVASIIANMFTEIKFAPWLKYRLNLGTQFRNYRSGSWTGPEATNHLTNRPNTAAYSNSQNFSWTLENLLYFDKTIANIHTLGVTLLQSSQKNRYEDIGTNVSNMIYPTALWYDLASNTTGRPDGYGTGFSENSLMSFMARVNYSLMDKYLLTLSARSDGASVLAPGHKWDFFPSMAVAWKMHQENFMQGINWVNELKPRFSYGVTGNSAVGPYWTSGPLSRNPYTFGSAPAIGYLPQVPANPDLGWEKTAQWNVGLDFSVISGRLSGTIEVYQQNTSDLLMDKQIPGVSGYVNKTQNIGKTKNSGVEITLSGTILEKNDFSWIADINWSQNKEEIVELLNGKEDMLAQGLFIGSPTQVYFHYENDGIWQNTESDLAEMAKFNANGLRFYPGTIKIVDQPTVDTDGDGVKDAGDYKINADDYVILGTNRPKWSGGITNTFQYKNWRLSSFIYFKVGQTYFGGFPGNRVENDRWSWDNPGGRWPMLNSGAVDNFTPAMQFSSGSFAAVRNISLSYAFPQDWLQKMAIKDLELNCQVLNPFLFGGDIVKMGLNPDDNTAWDNQSQARTNNTSPLGGTNNNTILQQSFMIGVRASF